MYPVELRGQRILLREFTLDDGDAVHRYAADPDVVRYVPWGPNTPHDTREFLDRVCASAADGERRDYELAIQLDGELVGAGGLRVSSRENHRGNIGYVLRRDVWGRGVATEAARALIEFGFDSLGLHRISATCDARNVASARVLEKAGMLREGLMREEVLIRGAWRDSFLYAVLSQEWNR